MRSDALSGGDAREGAPCDGASTPPPTLATAPAPAPASAGRPHRALLCSAAACLAAALLLGAAGLRGLLTEDGSSAAPKDLNGTTASFDPGTEPSAKVKAEMNAVPTTGERLTVPAVGLDVPLGALTMVAHNITPPGFTSAYRVRNLGVPLDRAADGTVFVAMHSMRNGGVGPGNYLIDVQKGTSSVSPGDRITVAGLDYTVTGSEAVPKTRIAADHSVWQNTPGRLVIITCLQVPKQTASVDNMVITATLEPGSSSPSTDAPSPAAVAG